MKDRCCYYNCDQAFDDSVDAAYFDSFVHFKNKNPLPFKFSIFMSSRSLNFAKLGREGRYSRCIPVAFMKRFSPKIILN